MENQGITILLKMSKISKDQNPNYFDSAIRNKEFFSIKTSKFKLTFQK